MLGIEEAMVVGRDESKKTCVDDAKDLDASCVMGSQEKVWCRDNNCRCVGKHLAHSRHIINAH